MWESRVLRRAFERLELHEGKLSRAVLRGGGGGDVTSLPDTWVGNHPGLPGPRTPRGPLNRSDPEDPCLTPRTPDPEDPSRTPRLCNRSRSRDPPGVLQPCLDPLLRDRGHLSRLVAWRKEASPASHDILIRPALGHVWIQPHQQVQMIVQNRKPCDGHREDFRKFLEPMFVPAFAVVSPFPEQEGPPHAARHTVIPARHGRISQMFVFSSLLLPLLPPLRVLPPFYFGRRQRALGLRLPRPERRCSGCSSPTIPFAVSR